MPKIEHSDFYSHELGMSLPVEITGHYGYPILMFPTSQGSYTQNHDFGLNDSISWFVDQGKVKLYNLQTIDKYSFYDKNISPHQRIRNYELFIRFLVKEYIPYLQKLHQTHRIAVAGASFGGYHSANLAFRFPDLFSHLFCLSGNFTCRSFMDGHQEDLVYFNSPEEFVSKDEAWKYKHMHIVLSTSEEDICLEPTRNMSKILNSRGIDHWYDVRKWAPHDWPLWRMVFPVFIGRFFA